MPSIFPGFVSPANINRTQKLLAIVTDPSLPGHQSMKDAPLSGHLCLTLFNRIPRPYFDCQIVLVACTSMQMQMQMQHVRPDPPPQSGMY